MVTASSQPCNLSRITREIGGCVSPHRGALPLLLVVALAAVLLLVTTPAVAQDDSPRPTVPVSDQEVVRGDSSRPWVSLVFNAGAGFTPGTAILDTLRERELRATFFLMGWWAERQPGLVARIAEEGHEVASHGHEIFNLTQATDAEVVADLSKADAVISGITGQTTKPLWSASAGYRDARVHRLAESIGYRPIFWTVDSGDWRTDAVGADVRARVLNNASSGAIVVMHLDSSRTADSVAPELPGIIDGLRDRGYRLVTITELVTGTLWENR